jgi:hypothetical protein
MARYIVTRDCEIAGETYRAGDVVIIEQPEYAAKLSSNSEGLLVRIDVEPARAVEAPPVDRMVRKAKGKRG